MITVPTVELCRLLTDAALFASTDKDDQFRHCVHLEWDPVDQELHTFATDTRRAAWVTWDGTEDTGEEGAEDRQDDLFTEWGGDDAEWDITVPLPSAKELVASYTLPAKIGRLPVDVGVEEGRLVVERDSETGLPFKRTEVKGVFITYTDVREVLQRTAAGRLRNGVLAVSPGHLAALGKVTPRGGDPMTFHPCEGAAYFQSGSTFRARLPYVLEAMNDHTLQPDRQAEVAAAVSS